MLCKLFRQSNAPDFSGARWFYICSRFAMAEPYTATNAMVRTRQISMRINWAMAQFFRERFSGELLTAQTIRQMKPTIGIAVRIRVPTQAPTDISAVFLLLARTYSGSML